MAKFPHYTQTDAMTCGPTCLRIIASYYGKNIPLAKLVALSRTQRSGSTLLGLKAAAQQIGFEAQGAKVPLAKLDETLTLPCIAHWNQSHFVVIYKITRNKIYVSDPGHGLLTYSKIEFFRQWTGEGVDQGVLLLLEPASEFKEDAIAGKEKSNQKSFLFIFGYLKAHKKPVIQLLIGLLLSSLLQLIFPFLTQSIVDVGIVNHDIKFIYLILFAQLMLFFGRVGIDIVRSYILMYVSSRINISLVSDFFSKLLRLPISYFDSKLTGDIMQRINDNHRIENFLTGTSLYTLFSLFNFIVFSIVLAWYNLQVFLVFLVSSIFYFSWILFFMKRRAELDYRLFSINGQNQSKVIELISGMQEIKLNNAEKQKRWQWEALQIKLFKINLKTLSLTITQQSGSSVINELKNIMITFLSAKLVLDGNISLGMMLSISYISGQLNAPVLDMVNFIQQLQDAKLSLERLGEIHHKEDEESGNNILMNANTPMQPFDIQNLFFRYDDLGSDMVLNDLSVYIPSNKITAIVGSSGSGKTTLLKLLLKYYQPTKGVMLLGGTDFQTISARSWRDKCGVVMQEGYIFSDTIAKNIAVGVDIIDEKKLLHAAFVANISEFIESLPLGFDTKIGMEGMGISTGQKQRLLIARAVYKNPDYIFLDEATSSLDANNEKKIMQHLNNFFKEKTVVIIAHRLSTVKNADQIIVLDKGKAIETGNHEQLVKLRGAYFELVRNQLELGN